MGDRKRENVMPVEPAVERELAYRRKIVKLQPSPEAEFWKGLLPLKVQSSFPTSTARRPNFSPSPGVSGTKQQLLTKSLELIQSSQLQELKGHKDYLYCDVCQVPCSGHRCYKQHIEGKRHLLKMRELKFGAKLGGNDLEVANQCKMCSLCKIWCMNEDALKAHLAGQKHKSQLSKLEVSNSGGFQTAKRQSRCELCNIVCSDENLLKAHFNGKRHKAELQRLKARSRGAGGAKSQHHCELCNIWCIDKDSFDRHGTLKVANTSSNSMKLRKEAPKWRGETAWLQRKGIDYNLRNYGKVN